jgi:hypothetical protein
MIEAKATEGTLLRCEAPRPQGGAYGPLAGQIVRGIVSPLKGYYSNKEEKFSSTTELPPLDYSIAIVSWM